MKPRMWKAALPRKGIWLASGRTAENSPAIYRWDLGLQPSQSRRDERASRSAVPAGLSITKTQPSDKSLYLFSVRSAGLRRLRPAAASPAGSIQIDLRRLENIGRAAAHRAALRPLNTYNAGGVPEGSRGLSESASDTPRSQCNELHPGQG